MLETVGPAVPDLMDLDILRRYESEKLLKSQRHQLYPLTIWNYTPQCQFSRAWDEVTMMCRGLVTDDDGRIAARPFPKFFNLDEHEAVTGQRLPDEPFEAFEKLDGSLIILFRYWWWMVVASRGSFTSPQAERAKAMLAPNVPVSPLGDATTYLFELICPENRIVIDYGDRDELVLLAAIDTPTGAEKPLPDLGCPVVRRLDHVGSFRDLPQRPNEEGYVLRFESGLRVKAKNEEYVRLHRLLTSTSAKTIWQAMQAGELDSFLDRVPDEFFDWVRETRDKLQSQFDGFVSSGRTALRQIDTSRDRKAIAAEISLYPSHLQPVMFALLDGKKPDRIIWKLIKPKREDTYRPVSEEEVA